MNIETFEALPRKTCLSPAVHKLLAYNSKEPIPTRGQFSCQVTVNGITRTISYTVVNNHAPIEKILCYRTLIVLDIIRMVRSVNYLSYEQFTKNFRHYSRKE